MLRCQELGERGQCLGMNAEVSGSVDQRLRLRERSKCHGRVGRLERAGEVWEDGETS